MCILSKYKVEEFIACIKKKIIIHFLYFIN